MYAAGGGRGRGEGSIVITIAPFAAGSWSQLLAYFIKVNPGLGGGNFRGVLNSSRTGRTSIDRHQLGNSTELCRIYENKTCLQSDLVNKNSTLKLKEFL